MEVKETMHEDSHEGGQAYDEKLWLKIPFGHVNFAIRRELAMLLDPPSSNDWRMLGDRLDFPSKLILWIPTRKLESNLGSDTLTLLQDFCRRESNDVNSVGLVMRALEKMQRLDALRVLKNNLKEIKDVYEKECRREESRRRAVPNSEPISQPNTHIKNHRCPEPMDDTESFITPMDECEGVIVNVPLDDHSYGTISDASRTIRLCQKCSTFTGPSSCSYNSLTSGQCSRCSRQLGEQNHNRCGNHSPRSPSHVRHGLCVSKSGRCSLPHGHEEAHSHQQYHSDSPKRSQTYPRCKSVLPTEQRSANGTMTHWTSANATMETGPFHQATVHARVFVTYAYEKREMRMVLSLCNCLKENKFPCSLDEPSEHFSSGDKHLWVMDKLGSVDFILVCVTQLYLDNIRTSFQPPSRSLSTAHIYRLMEAECRHRPCHRVIPLLFRGCPPASFPPGCRASQPSIAGQRSTRTSSSSL
ncbi:hypothetical protein LSAT2_003608 [Lamellibrachia satsuma]|nr:hypothetical protein LSAT2_003608 [Lamellibrachia satsuma]